ncbi:MAG: hypothetical protein Q4D98_12205 [Planctomycetia bacterium]|nr:hypothetical protein [Planctomycetia bacterium]
MKSSQIIVIVITVMLSILGIVACRPFSAAVPQQHVSYSYLAKEINGTTYTFLGMFSEKFSVIVVTNKRTIDGELNSETQSASIFLEGKSIPLDRSTVYFLSENDDVVPLSNYETIGVQYDFSSKEPFFENVISIIEMKLRNR